MRTATLGYLVSDGRVLLGEKKKAEIGTGFLNGAGGKLEGGESHEACLVRETEEEFGVTPTEFTKTAIIQFFTAGKPFQEVHIYLITAWTGEPLETSSMHLPDWYAVTALPYARMHESDREWIDRLFFSERFRARVYYQSPGKGYLGIEYQPF